MASRLKVLSSYRRLLAAQRHRFKGDDPMIQAARIETRNMYAAHRNETSPERLQALLADAEEARDFVLHGMVQGVLKDQNTYELRYDEYLSTPSDPPPADPKR